MVRIQSFEDSSIKFNSLCSFNLNAIQVEILLIGQTLSWFIGQTLFFIESRSTNKTKLSLLSLNSIANFKIHEIPKTKHFIVA